MKKTVKKKMSLKELNQAYKALLQELAYKHYTSPDSDFMEYCTGCQRSPYANPQHSEDCLVVKIHKILAL